MASFASRLAVIDGRTSVPGSVREPADETTTRRPERLEACDCRIVGEVLPKRGAAAD